jgi:general stress protein YciG
MICPHCKRKIADQDAVELIAEEAILRKSGSIRGARGRGPAKARDPELMRQAGKLGGRPKKKKPKGEKVVAREKRRSSEAARKPGNPPGSEFQQTFFASAGTESQRRLGATDPRGHDMRTARAIRNQIASDKTNGILSAWESDHGALHRNALELSARFERSTPVSNLRYSACSRCAWGQGSDGKPLA